MSTDDERNLVSKVRFPLSHFLLLTRMVGYGYSGRP